MGSTTVPRRVQTANPLWTMSVLWKLLAVIVILQTFAIYHTSAKQINTELNIDETFDIDDGPQAAAKYRAARDLDQQELIDDELQPFDDAADDDGSWLTKGIKRVRRELGRLLGTEAEPKKAKKHHKKRSHEHAAGAGPKGNNKKVRQAGEKLHKPHQKRSQQPKQPRKQLLNNKHNKRQLYDGEEGSGGYGPITGDEDEYGYETWRTLFTVSEPWNDAYEEGNSNVHFQELHRQIEIGFREVFMQAFGSRDDDDMLVRATLLKVLRTNDPYKVHVIVELQVPVKENNFEQYFRTHVEKYYRLGSLSAEFDSDYYYRLVEDRDTPLDLGTEYHFEERDNGAAAAGGGHGNDNGGQQHGGNAYEGGDRRGEEEYVTGGWDEGRGHEEGGDVDGGDETEESLRYDCKVNPDALFRCSNGQEVACSVRCDNYQDCDDGSDEEEQLCNSIQFEEDEDEEEGERAEPDNGEGQDQGRDVDGENNYDVTDAPQWDPYVCQRDAHGYFMCRSGESVPCHVFCDRRQDCADGSDELPELCGSVAPVTPEEEEEEEQDNVHIDPNNVDDRNVYGSGEGMDVTQRPWVTDPVYGQCRGDASYTCPKSNYQICEEQRCDGTEDCPDGEDEDNCGLDEDHWPTDCQESEFRCDSRCLPLEYRCNGAYECGDRTDEENCPSREDQDQECRPNQYRCRSGQCIDNSKRCNHYPDCPDGDDEDSSCPTTRHTPADCTRDEFFCDDQCRHIGIRCNGYPECRDRTDELGCPSSSSPHPTQRRPPSYPLIFPCPMHTCPNGKCYSENERCDGSPDCDDGADEANCCASNQFRCRNGDCIPDYAVCNNYPECADGSDEELCPDYQPKTCSPSQFRCNNGQCISASARCNGYSDCTDSSDEIDCSAPHPTPDNGQLNLKTYPDNQIIKESREVIFRCRDEGPLRAKVRWTKAGGRPLPAGSSDKNGRLEIPNIRVEDSGTYICEAVGYPRHVSGQQVTVTLTVERYNPLLDRPPSACRSNQATCMNGECIDKLQICDGIPHCSDGSDEHSCSHGRKCHPNQFMCRNSKCVDRIWRCDGENDCGDNSDEESCDPQPSGAPCRYDEFQCNSGHCIPKSFQCDDTNDCVDGSDEIGCSGPAEIRKPPPSVNLNIGDSLNITCVGTGVPVPVIVWRLNWGHVPEKCTSRSYAGTGTLSCPNMQVADSGAYSCEIINSKGTKFVQPDTLVTVNPGVSVDVCPAGFFNMLARSRDECINCFCFGVSKSCRSANLYNFHIQPPITSHRVVNVDLSPYSDISISEAPSSNIVAMHHGVEFRASDVRSFSRGSPYLALPHEYMGNQLKSYGGSVRYEVNYIGSGPPTSSPDVIITGNGFTLTHKSRSPAQANVNNKMAVAFNAGNWLKPDGRIATREEIMMVLANVENILLRLSYTEGTERIVELKHIVMDSAGLQDLGLGSASLVEQCTCPVGYIGDSCETCAPGFVRQPGGPWLGRCVPEEAPVCGPGTYGDPRRGIPCRECPCPMTGPGNFASGCSLGPDNDVICNCNRGYTGRRCEVCEPGYQGNPLAGSRCYPKPESPCNSEGTLYPHANGTCECKPLVTGARCDMCKPDSFHLNAFTYTGCIECFCSGLTKQCSSSSWNRDQISSNFESSRADHGFNLVRNYETPTPTDVPFQQGQSALLFHTQPTGDPLYWSLPPQFLGDKITAYGGRMNYTISYNPLPGGLMSRNSAPDVIIKSGEDLTIIHYRKATVNPSQATTYSVPILESAWHRTDGQQVNREHLLMALSKIEAIYIKATYTTSTKEGSLSYVSMDIAKEDYTGQSKAVEVEECRCPAGYVGLSCERCAPGYKRDSEAGLYLGVCEPCECNGHSDTCDTETGVCMNCQHNTDGEFCDRCAPGYEGNPSAGTPYDCQPTGTGPVPRPQPFPPVDNTECTHCNPSGTTSCDGSYCYCKPNVVGPRCDRCRAGTFGLTPENPEGCSECYCSGKSNQCRTASLYRQFIPIAFFADPPLLTDEEGTIADTENLHFDISTNEYLYNYTSYTPKYWSIRGSAALGNQLMSYGGELSYKLAVESYGHAQPGNDVILIGNGMKLMWSSPTEQQDKTEYRVKLHEDENWHRQDRGSVVRASRVDFMNVLSNLEHVLVRATPKIPTTRTVISDFILETAVETRVPGSRVASEVEVCTCPEGYSGSSCESCSSMHYRDNSGSCVACPCQDDTTSSCFLDERGYVECSCKPGFTGDRCQDRDHNQVNPQPTDRPDWETRITVSIIPPEITIIPVGGSLVLTCSGHFAMTGVPVFVTWYKMDGHLPSTAEQNGGTLQLYDLQIYDSGIYICQAVNNQTSTTFEDKISITISENDQRSPARIDNLPRYVEFVEYEPNEIACDASGNPQPQVTWTRVDGQMSLEAHTEGNRLIFESPRKSDEGSYRCQANNGVGVDEQYTQLVIRSGVQPPVREMVYIEPPRFTGESGEFVRLVCQSTTSMRYEWSKDGYPMYPQRNIIVNGNTLEIRDATPRDTGVYTCTGIDQRGRRNLTSDAQVVIEDNRQVVPGPGPGPIPGPNTVAPSIKRLPSDNQVIQGQDFSITCEANGSPYPNIRWTKVHESMADNVQQTGNVLRIINARPENRGMYLCIAENSAGSDQVHTIIEVEPRERPTVDVQPRDAQTVYAGGEASIYCTGNGIPEPTVQWRRVDGTPMSPRHTQETPGYLIIREVEAADDGVYECVAENAVGKAAGTSVLHVIVPPRIQLDPDTEVISFTEGDELRIVCAATGVPAPQVQWFDADNDVEIGSPQLNQAFLENRRVSQQDARTYKCKAWNGDNYDERYITVEIKQRRGDAPEDSDVDYGHHEPQVRPQQPTQGRPDTQLNRYQANKGDDVKLYCDLMPALMTTRWERVDGRPLPPNSRIEHNTLIISRVEEQNSGQYRCNAFNNRGAMVTYLLAELVLVPLPHITFHPKIPIVVTTNENVDIFCEVTGEQPIRVSWHTDNNRPLPPSVQIDGQYLRFVSITPADAGRYYCSASNRYGNTTEVAEVVVNRGHSYEPQPQTQQSYNINEGGDVSLRCDVTNAREQIRGDIRYTWHREDGRPLPQNAYVRNQELFLARVHKQDEGRYVCQPYTTDGSSFSVPTYVDLYITPVRPQLYVPPPTQPPRDLSLKLDQQHSNLRVGESTEVECYTSDNSYSDVMWERADGSPLPLHIQQIGNRLVITRATAADAGRYVCKCKTDEGDLYTTSYELEIEEGPHEWKRPKIVYVDVGSTAHMRCDADTSSGPQAYRWSRQYGQMQSGRDILNDELSLMNVQSNDAGTYICTATSPSGEPVDYPTILVVTGAIPQFHQDPVSYMAFPTLPESYIKFNFDITFRPEDANGLLLFNGQKRGSGDYISLSLNDGYPEFRYDFDGRPMVIRVEKPVALNEWHSINVMRFRRDGYMQVDDQHPVAFPTHSQVSPLDLIEDLYIGGVPNWSMLPSNAVAEEKGFKGCISRLTLQGSIIELMKEAKIKEGISPCQPCQDKPCQNGGICLESQTETAYTCICQDGWTGNDCNVEGTQCTPGICGAGRCENTEHGMECLCPMNKTGDRCQYIEHLNEQSLAFKRNSFAAYGTPRASRLHIKFKVRPNSLDDGILLYAAESKLPSGDFIALLLKDGHVELVLKAGALNPLVVRSHSPLVLNKWTEIEISRRFGEAVLRVGDEPEQKAKTNSLARTVYLKTPLYIGGYDHEGVKLNRAINVTDGFNGCVSNLEESLRKINLIADIEDAANIQNCGEINEIDQEVDEPNDNYEKPEPAAEPEAPKDPCAVEPCENGGSCSSHDGEAVCACSLGFTGKQCQYHVTLKDNVTFHGNGYLELDRVAFDDNIEQKDSSITLVFSTREANGLLVWWGQPAGEEFDGKDFISLAIVDGIFEVSVRLNGEETVIRNTDKRVDDGRRHIAIFKRNGNTAMLELDHVIDIGELRPTGKETITLPGNVFLGGMPEVAKFTGGRYNNNFNGCILVVEGDDTGPMQLGGIAVNGVNVDMCPYVDESLEAPVF